MRQIGILLAAVALLAGILGGCKPKDDNSEPKLLSAQRYYDIARNWRDADVSRKYVLTTESMDVADSRSDTLMQMQWEGDTLIAWRMQSGFNNDAETTLDMYFDGSYMYQRNTEEDGTVSTQSKYFYEPENGRSQLTAYRGLPLPELPDEFWASAPAASWNEGIAEVTLDLFTLPDEALDDVIDEMYGKELREWLGISALTLTLRVDSSNALKSYTLHNETQSGSLDTTITPEAVAENFTVTPPEDLDSYVEES